MNEDLIAKLRAVKVRTPEEVMAQYDHKFSAEDILNGRTFYNNTQEGESPAGVVVALHEALEYVGEDGIIATMPELIAAKCRANDSHELWQDWYTAQSEENIGIDQKGRFYGRDEPVLVVVHGGGLLTPTRIQQACDEGLIGNSARYTQEEFDALLRGELPNGDSLELYSYGEIEAGVSNLPHRFGVVMPYARAQETNHGVHAKREFLKNPLVIARNAGRENLERYFDLARGSGKVVGVWHVYPERDATQPQGRLLYLYERHLGLEGDISLSNGGGRFVGVAREANRE